MLTSDLVRFRKSGGKATPRYLGAKTKDRVLPVAAELVATYRASVGRTLGELDDAASAIGHEARDRLVVLGLRKLCDDRLLADRPDGLDPVATRAEVFLRAAKAHREATRPIDRDLILAGAAEALGTRVADVDAALFADLRAAQVIKGFDAVTPSDLLASYDLALAQAALFRATRVTLRFEGAAPAEVRAVFRAARFHGLLFSIARQADAFEVVVDGPFSLFGSAQKYGFRLAMFLPTALSLPRFELRADLRLGAAKEAVEMVITHADDVACRHAAPEAARPEIERLVSAFRALPSEWAVAPCDELLPLPGQAVIVPDLSFTSQRSGEVVYLEMMGFWSRDAVWKRIEQIERGLDARLIVAVKKSLRVSREALDESTGSSLLVFGTAPSAKEVLALLGGG
ncbi:MAG: DUF790 family protein [Polyangiaceae bacterium]|nr:DUF790 family protein [Polyangiaceae bacterium]